MKTALAILLASSLAAFAADPPKPAPVPPAQLFLTQQEVAVVAAALANAGAACDQNVQIYCQIVDLRRPALAKMQDAASAPAKKP